ncbi:uncharacterized protein Z518_05611 [Rhinocladiella mackenziei CBS 650.93]|uniref:Alpha/beta hydrolase fold-3 domain-containing protein n=1 Tax=Rhinocladiella mackenziei CBS 650.93 TaxID=1442369 RepID=A0A0D2INM8_9EURO|nr:uncharacterized protein Z518_05611 [Rhinocladiella mackenziei CBS 650.93]KIX04741.1 hypothetical protein Z518_05611 [Rhinocladiella mackenziei CBS 650.93]
MASSDNTEKCTSIIQFPDPEFFKELEALHIDHAGMPPGIDLRMREWIRGLFASLPKQPYLRPRIPVEIEDKQVGRFSVRLYRPPQPQAAILMFHGGGWIHGDVTNDEEFAIFFASELEALVMGVNYSLAPEHPFPSALDDCYEALSQIGTFNRVALWGTSAGGNLAAALALRVSQEEHPSPVRQLNLVVPVTKPHPILEEVIGLYTKDASNVTLPPPPEHHCPTHITVAGMDPLCNQGIEYAVRLQEVGVDAQLEIVPGVPHDFTMVRNARATKQWTEPSSPYFPPLEDCLGEVGPAFVDKLAQLLCTVKRRDVARRKGKELSGGHDVRFNFSYEGHHSRIFAEICQYA